MAKYIDKLPSGSYRVRIQFNGETHTKIFTNEKDAEAQLKDWQNRIHQLKAKRPSL